MRGWPSALCFPCLHPMCFSGHSLRMTCICVHLNQGFFVTGFNSYYKSSLDYLCMCVLNLLFCSLKSLFVRSGVQIVSRLLGLSECSHKGPDLVSKLNLRKLSTLCHCVHEIPQCAFEKLHWAGRDIASSSSCSVELQTLIPLPTVKAGDVVFHSLHRAPCTRQFFYPLAMHGKYPDPGNRHTVEEVTWLQTPLSEHQPLKSPARYQGVNYLHMSSTRIACPHAFYIFSSSVSLALLLSKWSSTKYYEERDAYT